MESSTTTLFFALGGERPKVLPDGVLQGVFRRTGFYGGNFCLDAIFSGMADRILLWATKSPRTPPPRRLLEIAIAVESLREIYACPIILVLPYGDCSRSNRPHCVRAYIRQLEAIPADRIVLFDLHREDYLDYFRKQPLQISTLSLWADHVRRLRPKIDLLVSPDLGRRNFVQRLAELLSTDHLCLDKTEKSNIPRTIAGRHIFLFDDEVVTGKTLKMATKQLNGGDVASISIGVTYAFCSDNVLSSLSRLTCVRSTAIGDLVHRRMPPYPTEILPLAPALLDIILCSLSQV